MINHATPKRPNITKFVTIGNQKGGVWKTSTCITLAAQYAAAGYSVCVLDLDKQLVGASYFLTKRSEELPKYSIKEVLYNKVDAVKAMYPITERLSLIMTSQYLTDDDIATLTQLRDVLKPLRGAVDYVFIDTPPALGRITEAALIASDRVVVPTTANEAGYAACYDFIKTIEFIKNGTEEIPAFNPRLLFCGIIPTNYKPRTVINRDYEKALAELADAAGGTVYTGIPNSTAAEEAQALGIIDLLQFAPKSGAARAYKILFDEIEGDI